MTPTYEITQLLYEVLERLGRIEKSLGIENIHNEEIDHLSLVEDIKSETVVKFPNTD